MKPILTIIRGTDFSRKIQLTSEPYPEGLLIQSSNNENPCVIETQLPHQLNTDDRVRISGHRKNTIVNGTQTVTVIDAFKFSVPVQGIIIGEVTGRVSKAIDISNYTFSGNTKIQHGGSAIENADPTVDKTTPLDGEITLTLTKEQTLLILAKSCILEITYVDADSKTNIFAVECEVRNA